MFSPLGGITERRRRKVPTRLTRVKQRREGGGPVSPPSDATYREVPLCRSAKLLPISL